LLKINNISKSFASIKALNNISFNVQKNELFGVIGPDGAGKTTLFRLITTLLLPDEGSLKVNNFDIISDYKEIRNITGYMPGRFSLYQDLTVEENLNFFATVFGTTIEENYYLIKDIYSQIEPFKNRLAKDLSGGMKQKLALSCALIHKPKILVLDEPTTGVDAVSRKEFWQMLKNLKENDITIIVSTPYMDEAELCDRVALMQLGEILDIDTPLNITKKFDKNLFALRSNNMFKLMKDIRNYENTESVFLFGQFLHYTNISDDFNIEEKLNNYLIGLNHENIEVKKIEPNIEDCFMRLMKK